MQHSREDDFAGSALQINNPPRKRLPVIRRNHVAGIVDMPVPERVHYRPGSPIPATDVLINVVV